jgi:hypothetical protein
MKMDQSVMDREMKIMTEKSTSGATNAVSAPMALDRMSERVKMSAWTMSMPCESVNKGTAADTPGRAQTAVC